MPSTRSACLAEWLLGLLLIVAYGWLFVFFPRINNPNEMVRVYMARAIAEEHTYAIGQRALKMGHLADQGPLFAEWGYVNDKSLVCDNPSLQGPYCTGLLYSGKAPGVSLVAAPIVFAQNAITQVVMRRPPSKDEYVFVLRWLLAILPTIALWLIVRRFLIARGVEAPLALAATLAGACGSLSYTFGQMVAGHQTTGIALAFGLMLICWPDREINREKREPMRAALTGLCLSAAVCFEYQSAPPAIGLTALWLFVRVLPGRYQSGFARSLLCFAIGAVPFTGLFAQFHTAAYAAPWKTGYSFLENAGFKQTMSPGIMGISLPTGERIWGSFFSPSLGLFFFAPWIALALGCLPLAWKKWRADDVTNKTTSVTSSRAKNLALPAALAVVAFYLFFQASQSLWRSGWTVGPRYITPLVPFAAIAVALAFQSLAPSARALAAALLGGAGAAAIVATGLASSVCQGFPDEPHGPLAEIVAPLLMHGWVPRNLLQLAGVPGLWSALPTFIALGLAAFVCLQTTWKIDAPIKVRKLGLWLAISVFVILAAGQWLTDAHAGPWGSAHFLATQWSPPNPPGAALFQ